MDKTLKQKFRQPFGFYMENLIGEHFLLNSIFTMYHNHAYAYEWGLDLQDKDIDQLKFILKIFDIDLEAIKERVFNILKGNIIYYDLDYIESIKKAFNTKNDNELFNKKIILLTTSRLVSSNNLEILRIQDHRLIVSEIKSQYGPKVDYRIEFERTQINRLLYLNNNGVNTTLIYCIALPYPKFVEIPFTDLYEKFEYFDDFNSKEFTGTDWSDLRIRIPKQYREDNIFEKINESLFTYKDEYSLFKSILEEFPGKFSRLEKYLE